MSDASVPTPRTISFAVETSRTRYSGIHGSAGTTTDRSIINFQSGVKSPVNAYQRPRLMRNIKAMSLITMLNAKIYSIWRVFCLLPRQGTILLPTTRQTRKAIEPAVEMISRSIRVKRIQRTLLPIMHRVRTPYQLCNITNAASLARQTMTVPRAATLAACAPCSPNSISRAQEQ